MNSTDQEATLFTSYLVGKGVTPQALRLYKVAMADSKPNAADAKLLKFMARHPRTIGLIDAGLIFHNPHSEARRRIYVMAAILEASAEFHDLFLPKARSSFYVVVVFYAGIRGVIKAGLGLLLLKVVS